MKKILKTNQIDNIYELLCDKIEYYDLNIPKINLEFIYNLLSLFHKEISRIHQKLETNWGEFETKIDDFFIGIVQKTVMPFLYIGAIYLSIQHLSLPIIVTRIMNIVGVSILTIMAIRFLVSVINFFILSFSIKGTANDARGKNLRGVANIIKVVVWGVGIVFLLDNMEELVDRLLEELLVEL